ncbi:5-methylthioadenosine/S-adenosylhomocysteine deaminase-like isoform X1 [Balamuthia mandrillaris]
MDAEGRFYRKGFLLVRNDRIVALSSSEEEVLAVLNAAEAQAAAPPEVVELDGKWVLPGLINTHCHTNQQLARGLGDDVDLTTWLHERIWPFESHMTFEDCRVSALLCGVEQIRSGVTCFADAGGQHVEAIAEAVKELGLRGVLSMSVMDTGEGLPEGWKATTTEQVIEQQERLFDQLHDTADGRIRMWFNLRTLMNCSDDLVKATQQAADKRGVGIHMHVAEFKFEVDLIQRTRGSPTVTHLHKLGCLSHNLLAVHSVHLTPEELQLYKKNNVKVSHCPAAAMRYLGFPLIPEMIAEGITVGLGTDGAPSNNRMSIVDEMWLANLLHKVRTNDPQVMPSSAVLSMATLQGAKCLLWDNEIGSLVRFLLLFIRFVFISHSLKKLDLLLHVARFEQKESGQKSRPDRDKSRHSKHAPRSSIRALQPGNCHAKP